MSSLSTKKEKTPKKKQWWSENRIYMVNVKLMSYETDAFYDLLHRFENMGQTGRIDHQSN